MATLVYRNPNWIPEGERQYLFKCHNCGSFFMSTAQGWLRRSEPCPVCDCTADRKHVYPEWKYKLMMLFREVTKDA